jgi:hypothetical protein
MFSRLAPAICIEVAVPKFICGRLDFLHRIHAGLVVVRQVDFCSDKVARLRNKIACEFDVDD